MQIVNKQHIFFLSIIALSTAFFLAPLSTSAQIVNIPDANLRAAINEMLGKPENARITHEDMLTLTELFADNRGIIDLTGLETATNLRVFAGWGTPVVNLEGIAELPKFHEIIHCRRGLKPRLSRIINAIRDPHP